MHTRLVGLVALFLVGCGAAATPQATAPTPTPAPSAAPTASATTATAPPPPKGLAAAPNGVAIPPPLCGDYVERNGAASCPEDRKQLLSALAAALREKDGGARDAALVGLEGCAALPAGIVRGLRAESAPVECGDVIVGPFLAGAAGDELRSDVHDALMGLGIAAQLSRTVHDPPRLATPFDKKKFSEFLQGTLVPWIEVQARAIGELSRAGVKLVGYGKGVVAVEAGLADLRFVEEIRGVPLPPDMAKDSELADVYFSSLDDALEPRKTRGRDAALVGLKVMAEVGALSDAGVDHARGLLSKLYAGHRVDALDGLLLPPLPALDVARPEAALAAVAPTFYAGLLLRDADLSDGVLLRALLERGVPAEARQRLDASALSPETRQLWARAQIGLGQRYFRSADFGRAAATSQIGTTDKGATSDAARLYTALGRALEGGPKDAAEMMLTGPVLAKGLGDVTALDEIARSKSPFAGIAAFDAAYLLQVAPPGAPDAAFWKDLGKRYQAAARLLRDPAQQKEAKARAKAAEDTHKALEHAR